MNVSVEIKNKILQSINMVYEKSKKCKLENSFFNTVNSELGVISEYLKINKTQAFIYAVVFAKNYEGETVDFSDLIKYFKCSSVKLLYLSNDFDYLTEKGYFNLIKSTYKGKLDRSNNQYYVNETVTEALINSNPLPSLNKNEFDDIIKLLNHIYEIGKEKEDNQLDYSRFGKKLFVAIKSNLKYPLINWLNNQELTIYEKYIFLHLLWKKLNGTEKEDLDDIMEIIYSYQPQKIKEVQKIINEIHPLIKLNLIEINKSRFLEDTEISLSDKAIRIIKEHKIEIYTSKIKKDYILEPESISEKKLFYNKSEKEQILMLNHILDEKDFNEIKQRMKNKNLPSGVTILFFGAPGTGKTETVFQTAKKTGRKIMQVDISNTKSMWFGESEKKIKKVFTEYYELMKENDRVPVLLFNEADAIISKRKNNFTGNTDQTENTIQNIILQELEKFEGIFIATTNLAENFDSAFERRFLYKIKFNKPGAEVKLKIWKSKITVLKNEQYKLLSSNYDFSGGQIDNIVRKINMFEVIKGKLPDFKEIIEYCNTEKIAYKNIKTVGFAKK